ncbi:MAG: VOC family protein [Chloroflexi bacterium]|nr:VOC family protein [Chloroflexota bacterium]
MQPRISLITLGVADLERAIRFYRDGLGFPMSGASVAGEVAFFRTGGVALALYPRHLLAHDANLAPEGTGFGGIALAHNVRAKEEVDDVISQAVAAGGRLLKAARQADWGGYSGYFADPDGHPWEVAWNPFFPFAADGTLQLPP